jgi:hypothetical protein
MKVIKLGDLVRVIRPEYVYLRLKPNNSIRNNSTHKLARAIASLYRNILENVRNEQVKVTRIFGKQFFIPTEVSFTTPSKVSYFIYIEKKKVEFYFIVPRSQLSVIKEKIGDVWANITIEEVGSVPEFDKAATKYQLTYTKESGLSLAIDRRNSDLLYSTLNVIDVLEECDKVGLFYNFMPTSQFSCRATYKNTIAKVLKNIPVDRNKMGSTYVFKMALAMLSGLVDTITGVFSDNKKGATNPLEAMVERLNGGIKISESTQRKAGASILNTQIIVMSSSKDALRQRNNARSLAQSFDSISEDNSLRYRPYRGQMRYTDFMLRRADVNKMGDEECQSFLALAA